MREFILLYDDDDYDNLWDEKEALTGGEVCAREESQVENGRGYERKISN